MYFKEQGPNDYGSKGKICKVGWQAEDPGKISNLCSKTGSGTKFLHFP